MAPGVSSVVMATAMLFLKKKIANLSNFQKGNVPVAELFLTTGARGGLTPVKGGCMLTADMKETASGACEL